LAIGPDAGCVLQPNAQAALGVIQAGFDGKDMAGSQDVLIGGRQAEVGRFVHLQPQPVGQAVDIAILGTEIAHHRWMPECFKLLAC
jgi:hypothetical protein